MIHYYCDCCMRPLDPKRDLRYVVRVEVYSAANDDSQCQEDRDHLQEIQDILDGLEDDEPCAADSEEYQKLRFDLCRDCRKRFLRDPMGRKVTQFNFSKN